MKIEKLTQTHIDQIASTWALKLNRPKTYYIFFLKEVRDGNKDIEVLPFFVIKLLHQLGYEIKGKTELTYPEFIKLFEGGESDGWIKIKNEKDLPKVDILYWVVKNGEVVDMENWELTLNFHNKRGVTHYQPIQKPEPPKF